MRIQNKAEVLGVQPLLQWSGEWREHGEPEVEAIRSALAAGEWGIGSPAIETLEGKFASVQGLPATHSVVPVTNGTHAIQLALEALNVGFGDDVVVPNLTWQATAGAVLDVNAVPVLIDVRRDSWTIDPERVEAYFRSCRRHGRPLPKVLIVVHLYCQIADLDRLTRLCREYGVFLVEDCAHSHGGRWRDRAVGSYGVIGTFSTQSSKVLASGEGGLIVTGVPQLDMRLRSLISCGRQVSESAIDESIEPDELTAHWRKEVAELELERWPIQSGNYRMNGVTAALLNAQLDRFSDAHAVRVATLRELYARRAELEELGIRLPADQPQATTPIAYMLACELDPDAFGGMDQEVFREVLSYLLGGHFVLAPYDPLGGGGLDYRSPVYNPRTKQRHKLSEQYWAAIDPTTFNCPVSHQLFKHGVTIMHPFLSLPGAVDTLITALRSIETNATRIVEAAA